MREQGEFEFVDEPLAIYRTTPALERMLKSEVTHPSATAGSH